MTAIQAVTGAQSVNDLKAVLAHSNFMPYVRGLTPDTDIALVGVTRQITPRWQPGGDIHDDSRNQIWPGKYSHGYFGSNNTDRYPA